LNTLRALWVTGRPYLMFVSGAAALVGLALGRAPIVHVVPAFVVLFVSYGLGQALTDVFQTDTDALSAPERPLVQGTIDKRTVLIASLGGLTACAAVIVLLSPTAALPAAIAIAMLATYTPLKRRWWGGPPWNSAVVALLPLLGAWPGDGTRRGPRRRSGPCRDGVVVWYLRRVRNPWLPEGRRSGPRDSLQHRGGAVRSSRAVVASAAFATLGLAASVWLVQAALTVSAGTALWSVGAVLLVGAHVLAWKSTTDYDAWPGIQASVHGFVALHLGEAAAIKPRWTLVAWILFGASIVAMFRRPVRRQV
jgi:4-hydroxybenzoate polyprenyltransferase